MSALGLIKKRARHSGAPKRSEGEPGIHSPRAVVMDSGLSASFVGLAPE